VGALLFCIAVYLGVYTIDTKQTDVFSYALYPARGAAGVILVCSALILLFVAYHSISKVSRLLNGSVHVITHNIEFHMYLGMAIVFFSAIHTVCWAVCFMYQETATQDQWDALEGEINEEWDSPPSQWDLHLSLPGITGWIMMLCLVLMGFTSRDKQRKKRFNVFFNVHHLYVVFFACLLLHGSARYVAEPKAWKFISFGLVVYALDKLYGVCQRNRSREMVIQQSDDFSKTGTVRVDVKLERKHPENHLAQWVWVNVPEISCTEWHPFTIANADKTTATLQIQDNGDWTHRLFELGNAKESLTRCFVEGPVGCLGSQFLKYKYMVLIGTGVGVTPYACIIDWIMRRFQEGKEIPFEKVYFIWSIRDQKAFQWFGELCQELHRKWDGFELKVFLTSRDANNVSALGYNMLARSTRKLSLKGVGQNPTEFQIGRPDYPQIFSDIRDVHPNKEDEVGVFFCGPKPVSSVLENCVQTFSSPDSCVFKYFPEFFT